MLFNPHACRPGRCLWALLIRLRRGVLCLLATWRPIELTSVVAALIEGEPHILVLGEGGLQPLASIDLKWLNWGIAHGRSKHARAWGIYTDA